MNGHVKWLTILCTAIFCAGCMNGDGLNRASVRGTVTLDGKPLESGFVAWFPLNNEGPSVATAIRNGNYTLASKRGPVVGEYRIEINGPLVRTGKKVPSGMNPKILIDEEVDLVPSKYRSTGTMGKLRDSELKATVVSGKNKIDFALTTGS